MTEIPFEKRVNYLFDNGSITYAIHGAFADGYRPIVIANMNGIKQPFYRSAHGTSGKQKGAWHPFFGFGRQRTANGQGIIGGLSWMIKGTLEENNNFYGCKSIRNFVEMFNGFLNWPHELDSIHNKYFAPFTNWTGRKEDFNKLIFGNEDLQVWHGDVSSERHINNIIKKLNGVRVE